MKSFRPYKPYLDAHLELGFMGFHTMLMSHSIERYAYDYIGLKWHFFKWNGMFRLYKPGKDFK